MSTVFAICGIPAEAENGKRAYAKAARKTAVCLPFHNSPPGPYAGPFQTSSRTRKTDSGSVITVVDNGRGFDLTDDSEPRIALKNIQQRLEMMCGGSISITPRDGGGTVVSMTIPDSAGGE